MHIQFEKDSSVLRPSHTLLAILLMGSTLASPAQVAPVPGAATTAASGTEDVIQLEAFSVTGSNIKRMEVEKVLPVSVLTQDAIEARNPATPVEMLTSLPQVTNVPTNEFGSSMNSARGDAASVNLRGIGSGNTLLLLDGLRIAPRAGITSENGISTLATNVNAMPSRGVARIDVLRDGASSLYGSDATAGVINYITKTGYQGTEVVVRLGKPEHPGGENAEFAITNGFSFLDGKAHLLSTISYLYREPIWFRDREFTRNPDQSPLAPPPFNDPGSAFNGLEALGKAPAFRIGTATQLNYFRPVNGVWTLTNVAPTRAANPEYYLNNEAYTGQPRTDRGSLYEKLTYRFNDRITGNINAFYYRATSNALRAPMRAVNTGEGRFPMGADNPFNPYGSRFYHPTGAPNADGTPRLVGTPRDIQISDYILPDYPNENIESDSQIYRWAASLEGKLGDTWTWNLSGLHSSSRIRDISPRNVYIPTYAAALLRTDETAFNPFGYTFKVQNGAVVADQVYHNSPRVLRGIEARYRNDATASVQSAALRAGGEVWDLWSGPISLSFGSEYRTEDYTQVRQPPSLPDIRQFLGGGALEDSKGDRSVFSVYTETVAPLAAPQNEIPLVYSLELSAAVRFEDYSDFGETTNPKYGINWKPYESLMIRASYNKGFRAPPLPALYRGVQTLTGNSTDNYRNPVTAQGSQPANTTTGSSLDLKPELTTGRTIGIVLEVPKITGLTLTADYWEIDQSDVLVSFSAGNILSNDEIVLKEYTQKQLAAGVPINQIDTGSGTANYKGDPRVTRQPVTPQDQALFNAYNATRPPSQQLAAAGLVFNTKALPENRASGAIAGVDYGINYALPELPIGRLTFSVNGAYLIESYTIPNPGGPRFERIARGGAARNRGDANVNWRKDNWSAGLSAYYIGSMMDTAAQTTAAVYESLGRPSYIAKTFDQGRDFYYFVVEDAMTFNFNISYNFDSDSRWFKNTRVRVAVNNVLDEEPPLAAGLGVTSVYGAYLAGRAYTVELTRQF